MIQFITGNKNKFKEIKAVIPNIKQLDIDLPEIQETDSKAIIREKLLEAMKHHKGEFIVEDTSLHFEHLNGFPGPLIKWLLKSIGNEGISEMINKLGNNRAQAITRIGYAKSPEEIYFFEGIVDGAITDLRGESNFGWEPIFLPDGYNKTYAEMTFEEKNAISMRYLAAKQLKEFLDSKNN